MKFRTIRQLLILTTLTTILSPSLQTLKIISNSDLVDSLEGIDDAKNISYALSIFGSFPYGMNILGFAHFDENNADGCNPESIVPYSERDVMPFLVVRRGNCQFITKAQNAARAGAKVLIIVDNVEEELDFHPAADYGGKEIHIPSMVIKMKVGEKIIEMLKNEDQDQAQSVVMSFTNPLKQSLFVDLQIVLSANDRKAFEFMSDFNDIADSLGSRLNTTLNFYMDQCLECDPETLKRDCLNKNPKYCYSTYLTDGAAIVKAQVVQRSFFTALSETNDFFAYAGQYLKNCLDKSVADLARCASAQRTGFSYSKIIYDLTYNTLTVQDPIETSYIAQDADFVKKRNIMSSPIILVNGQVIRGSLTSDNVLEAVCMAFSEPPSACSYIEGKFRYVKKVDNRIQKGIKQTRKFHYINIFMILVFVVFAAIAFNFAFGKIFKRIMDQKIDDVVERTINSYKSVGDTQMEMTDYQN